MCSGDPNFNMLDELNGSPEIGGIWYNPNDLNVDSYFNPNSPLVGT